jgi:hypothetical protein
MQNLLTAMRKFWGRKATPANIGEELTVGVGEAGLPFERDPHEWAALLDWLRNAECTRNGQVRRVLCSYLHVLDAGTKLYRARKHQSEQALREELKQQPNYFATSKISEKQYIEWMPAGPKPFLIEATVKQTLHLADVVAFEVVKVVNEGTDVAGGARVGPFPALGADPRFHGDGIGIQRWLVWEAARQLQSSDAPELDGVWDNDGADVLIAYPQATLELAISSL